MKIILQENLEKVGTRGQVVDVADGYARNYLLPRKLALAATPGNLKQLERIRARLAKIEAQEHSQAQEIASVISNAVVTLSRKAGQTDQLFGSVTAADIAESLAEQGFTVDKRKVVLGEPIKVVGEYQVPVKLHHNVVTNVKVVVLREGEPLEPAESETAEAESEPTTSESGAPEPAASEPAPESE